MKDPPQSQSLEVKIAGSNAGFSGFGPNDDEDSEGDHDSPIRSVLLQGTKAYGFIKCISAGTEAQVTDMVNHLFDNRMCEAGYREVMEDYITMRSRNWYALDPIECNMQILEALKPDNKQADFHIKDVCRYKLIQGFYNYC